MNKEEKILIVEDDYLIAEVISQALEKAGYKKILMADSLPSAIEMIEQHIPQIVLTDINFEKEKTGIDLGHLLFTKYKIPFIYISSHASAAIVEKAKHTKPSAFIIKPFKNEDVLVALELALYNLNATETTDKQWDMVTLKAGKVLHKIQCSDIYYIESKGNYTDIHLPNAQKRTIRLSLTETQNELPSKKFIRIHKSYIINRSYITEIRTSSILLQNVELPIGRTYKEGVIGFFQ